MKFSAMEKFVIKRNGNYRPFSWYKIEAAIEKGFGSVMQETDPQVIGQVSKALESKVTWAVEEIQDIIEKEIFEAGHFKVLKSFVLYRHTRKMQRDHVNGMEENTTYVNSTQTIEEYTGKSDWRIHANANTSYSNAGLVNNVSGKIIANFWLDSVYSKEEGYAHRNADIHIHDL